MKRQLVRPLESTDGTTRCSALDSILVACYPSIALCYPERLDPKRLRDALAHVLTDYGMFAGRLRVAKQNFFLDHGVGGVEFEVVQSPRSSMELGLAVRSQHSKLLCPQISALGAVRGKSPLLAVRVTQTPDGCVLGIVWNHAVGDHHSFMMLMRAWVNAYRSQPFEKPVAVSDRDAYLSERLPKPTDGHNAWRVLSWPEFIRFYYHQFRVTRPARRVILEFSRAEISAIHAAATGEKSVTVHDAFTAHLFLMLHRLDQNVVSPRFSMAIDYRKRLGLPTNLLGNMSDMVTTTAAAHDDTASIAAALRAGVDSFGTGSIIQQDLVRLHAAHPRFSQRVRYWRQFVDPECINLNLTNVSSTGHATLIFEAAGPSLVHARALDTLASGLGSILKSPQGAGLTVDLVLSEKLAQRLEQTNYRAPLPAQPGAAQTLSQPFASL